MARGSRRALIGTLERDVPESVSEFRLLAGSKSEQHLSMYERRGYREFDRIIDALGIELVVMRKERT
jgi:hypothetical protein